MKKAEQSPQGPVVANFLPQRRTQATAPAGGPLSSLAAALNQSPVVQAQMKLAQEINQGWYRGVEYDPRQSVAGDNDPPAEASLDTHSAANETAAISSNAPIQRHAVVQRVTYGAKLAAQFGAGPPEGEQAAGAYDGGKHFGKEFTINATFNPDRVRIGDEGSDEETYHTVEYRQYIRGEFRSNGQVVPTKLYKETVLDKTKFREDGKKDLRYGHRNEGDNHGKYKDEGESGSSYTGIDYPSINVDKGETVSINLDFVGKLVVTDAQSKIAGPVLAQREWSIKGTYTRPKSAAVALPKPEGKQEEKSPAPPPGKSGKKASPPGKSGKKAPPPGRSGKKSPPPGKPGKKGKNWSMALESEVLNDYESADSESAFVEDVSTFSFGENSATSATQLARAPVTQLAKAGAIHGIAGDPNREKALVAGYLAHTLNKDLDSSAGPDAILVNGGLGEGRDYLTGDAWQNVEIPEWLASRIAILPSYYVPTTAKIWKEFIDRVAGRSGQLAVPEASAIDSSRQGLNVEVERARAGILETVTGKIGIVPATELNEDEQRLFNQIMNADITVNFSIDKLFNYRSPQLLNAFEVQERIKSKGGSVPKGNNIQGELEEQRKAAEAKHFGISTGEAPSRLRPRYAALNFKGHPAGATARNDYGLSYMVLSKAIASSCTLTLGDSFDAARVYPYTAGGVKKLVLNIFRGRDEESYNRDDVTAETPYSPGDTYLEVQIHQDLDLRSDVERIMVSTVEMRIFQLEVRTVKDMIDALAGEGVFIQQ